MPARYELRLGAAYPDCDNLVFSGWVSSNLGRYIGKETPFARVHCNDGEGVLLTSGPCVIDEPEINLTPGQQITPETVFGSVMADGEDCPYGDTPRCLFRYGTPSPWWQFWRR